MKLSFIAMPVRNCKDKHETWNNYCLSDKPFSTLITRISVRLFS